MERANDIDENRLKKASFWFCGKVIAELNGLDGEESLVAEFIVVTWIMIQNRWEQHEEDIKKNLEYWRKNAKRFKLKSMKYYAQALGCDSFHYGRALVLEFETLNDWEAFRVYIEENEEALALKEQWLINVDTKTLRIIEWQDRQRDAWLESH